MDAAIAFSNLLTSNLTTPRVNTFSVKKNKQVESRIGFCTKYNKLDRTKISKCYHCKNIVDLNNEGLSQESLSNYGRLSETLAVQISYVCNHCCSMLELIKSLQERLESNPKSCDSISLYIEEKRDFLNRADETLEEIKQLGNKIESFNKEFDDVKIFQDIISTNVRCYSGLFKENCTKTKVLEKQISDISDKLDVLELKVSSQEHKTIPLNSDLTDASSLNRENRCQFLRRKRVVFIGVPMGMTDMNFINELSKLLKLDIDGSKILKTFRVNARNIPPGKTQPLNVEFYNTRDKFAFLNILAKNDRCSFLDNTKFKNVRCFPDRTYQQRENFKALKLEMEIKNHQLEAQGVFGERYDIRNMTLVKVNVSGEDEDLD